MKLLNIVGENILQASEQRFFQVVLVNNFANSGYCVIFELTIVSSLSLKIKMPPINVRLRIVGVYFNHKVTIDSDTVTTVKGVMEAYQSSHSDVNEEKGFQFITAKVGKKPHVKIESLVEVIYNYPGDYLFADPNSPAEDDPADMNQKTLSGKVRPAGILRLKEQDLPSTEDGVKVGTSWQYYVVGKDGVNRSATKYESGFQGYNDTKESYKPFVEGDTIIWRLVVLTLPSFPEYKETE